MSQVANLFSSAADNYLTDSYGQNASSAVSAQGFMRSSCPLALMVHYRS